MTRNAALVFALVFCSLSVYGQAADPISDTVKVIINGGRNEIIGSNYADIFISKYYKAMEFASVDTIVTMLRWTPVANGGLIEALPAKFTTYPLPEIATLSVSADGDSLTIGLCEPERASLTNPAVARWARTRTFSQSTPAMFRANSYGLWRGVMASLAVGRFAGDSVCQLVVGSWIDKGAENGAVNLSVYNVTDTLTATRMTSLNVLDMPPPPKEPHTYEQILAQPYFDVAAVDFDGDSVDEVLLLARVPHAPSGRSLLGRIYQYDPSGKTLVLRAEATLFTSTDTLYELDGVKITAGRFSSPLHDDAVAGFRLSNPANANDTLSIHLLSLGASAGLDGLVLYQDATLVHEYAATTWAGQSLTSTDVDGDGLVEALTGMTSGNGSDAYRVTADHQFVKIGSGFTAVGDIRADSTAAEMITVDQSIHDFYPLYPAKVYAVEKAGGNVVPGQLRTTGYLPYNVLGFADFDGDLRLGQPTKYRLTRVLQPLVILNAPPTHFDVFDGVKYDVSKNFLTEGKFSTMYSKTINTTHAVGVEITSDWGFSKEVHAGFKFLKFSAEAHFEEKEGKKFSKNTQMNTSFTISSQATSTQDDLIYAAIMDVDVWEYPVLLGKEEVANFLVVYPQPIEQTWFPSSTWNGYSYTPDHEVGNVLSYREYSKSSDNPAVVQSIKSDFTTRFYLGSGSTYNWDLSFADFSLQSGSDTWTHSLEWSAKADAWGSGFKLKETYSKSVITSQQTTVGDSLRISVHLDGLDMQIGDVSYGVQPYAYWSASGALVIDYAVKPDIQPPGGTATWWQTRYGGKPDPAFILPWRLDKEKGIKEVDPAKSTMTKDVYAFPANAAPGDDVTLYALVRNFSLLPTQQPVGVRFYIGNPDSGGTLITGAGGVSQAFTPLAVPARGVDTAKLVWTVPAGISAHQRLYAVIDQGNAIDEIHETNNMGWNIFNTTSTTDVPWKGAQGEPLRSRLEQNWPNPFNPATTISFYVAPVGGDGSSSTQVRLAVYDVIGREVAVLVDGRMESGIHDVVFNANRLASGIYFYRLLAGGFAETKKMVLLR
jgi:hypothetical protein